MASRFSMWLDHYRTKLHKLSRNKHVNFGIPFLVFVIGGSFVLKEFAKIRYEFTKVNPYDLPTRAQQIPASPPVDINEEYEKIMKRLDIDNWENKRIPRPWEEGGTSSS